jgi:hypothetical protein
MGTYEDERLIKEISAVHLELKQANQQSWERGYLSEQAFVAIRGDLEMIDNSVSGATDSFQQIAFSLDWHLPLIVNQLARSGELLEHIMNSVQNPVTTQAYELKRHGLLAVKNGWASEAITEFRKSIEVYGYDPGVHFALGYVLAEEQEFWAAAESYSKSAKYGFPKDHSLAVSAAIHAADLYDGRGASGQAIDILVSCHEAIPAAANVAYELALRTRRRQHLSAALSLKPSLAVKARADNLEELEDAAHEVLDSSPGFARLQADAAGVSDKLAALLQQGGRSSQKVVPLPNFFPASARLFFFAEELPLTRERLSSAISEVRACAAELSEHAHNSLRDAENAQRGLAKPAVPATPNNTSHMVMRSATWGITALVMLIIALFFANSDSIDTEAGKLIVLLLSWVGFVVSGANFVLSIRRARAKTHENAVAQTHMEDYRKRLAAYEMKYRRAADLRSIAAEASRKASAFNHEVDSVIPAAEEVRRRLDWSVVEPIAPPWSRDTTKHHRKGGQESDRR